MLINILLNTLASFILEIYVYQVQKNYILKNKLNSIFHALIYSIEIFGIFTLVINPKYEWIKNIKNTLQVTVNNLLRIIGLKKLY